MKKFYEKNETTFAILWIVIYVVVMSAAGSISGDTAVNSVTGLIAAAVMSIILFLFVTKNGLSDKYGLCSFKSRPSELLYCMPLAVVVVIRLFHGFPEDGVTVSMWAGFVTMLFVGFLEEIIFRGLLFKAMVKDGIRSAIVWSSLTFAIGHVVNLLNGSGMSLMQNVLQIVLAAIFGFCLVLTFYRGGSLWPCIITHGLFNALGVIVRDRDFINGRVSWIFIMQLLILGIYAVYLLRLKNIDT